jgi:hypothetical protein
MIPKTKIVLLPLSLSSSGWAGTDYSFSGLSWLYKFSILGYWESAWRYVLCIYGSYG